MTRTSPRRQAARSAIALFSGLAHAIWAIPLARTAFVARARRAWYESDAVLVACRGNAWRSPFAAMLARDVLDDATVRSAGFRASAGSPAPWQAVALAAHWDVDLTAHRAAVVTRSLVEDADAIFVFDAHDVIGIIRRYPRAFSRVHLLGALDPSEFPVIVDPHGRPPEVQRATFERIAAVIRSLGDANDVVSRSRAG